MPFFIKTEIIKKQYLINHDLKEKIINDHINWIKKLKKEGINIKSGFLVDENMENYISIYTWLRGLGFPETTQQFRNITTDVDGQRDPKEAFCDGTLRILNSNYREVAKVQFNDLFPTSLTSLDFDATNTDVQYFTAEATFKYTVYKIASSTT